MKSSAQKIQIYNFIAADSTLGGIPVLDLLVRGRDLLFSTSEGIKSIRLTNDARYVGLNHYLLEAITIEKKELKGVRALINPHERCGVMHVY